MSIQQWNQELRELEPLGKSLNRANAPRRTDMCGTFPSQVAAERAERALIGLSDPCTLLPAPLLIGSLAHFGQLLVPL